MDDEEEGGKKKKKKRAIKLYDTGIIPNARKHLWSGPVTVNDIPTMSEEDVEKNVIKTKLWKTPNYAELVEMGMDPIVAFAVREIYNSIAARPATA